MDNLVSTEYGIFREKDIPLLIPDSPQRGVIVWLLVCIIIFIIAYLAVYFFAKPEKRHLVQKRLTLVREFTEVQLLLNNTICRTIYIFGKDLINIRDFKVNDGVPIRLENYYINQKENMLRIDFGQDIVINSLSFSTAEPILRLFARNESGAKVLDIV